MEKYETLKIQNVETLKQPTIYFYLKNNGFSENYIKNLRNATGSILLNGENVNIRAKINNGDCLQIEKSPNKRTDILLCEGNLDILFEDEDFLIVNKPHNLSCMPNRSHYSNNLGGQICAYMQNKDPNFTLRILNRLDKETAGIVVTAKNVMAYNNIKIEKEYHTICHGIVEDDLTIDKPILTVIENGINQLKRVISDKGKQSITHIHPIKSINKDGQTFTLLSVKLETGRTHQIRVHMESIGHTLVGDQIYGQDITPNHAMLVLKKLSFVHFRTNEKIEIEVPYPQDWKILI